MSMHRNMAVRERCERYTLQVVYCEAEQFVHLAEAIQHIDTYLHMLYTHAFWLTVDDAVLCL